MKPTFVEIITMIFELMHAIKYLHDSDLIYRDLKPDNIMIDSDKTVILIDFDKIKRNEYKMKITK